MNPQILLQFAFDHWALVGLFVVLFIFVFSYDRINTQLSGLGVSPQALVKLMNHDDALVLDIRPRDQFCHGHIIDAVNIPASKMAKDVTVLGDYKGQTVAIVCHRDSEGAKIARLMRKSKDFPVIKILTGGMAQWTNANLPIEKEKR